MSAIGAKDCGLHFGEGVKTYPPDSGKPFCLVDPPKPCLAFCTDVDTVDFTTNCLDPGADTVTAQFIEGVREVADARLSAGEHFCDEPDAKYGVFAVIDGEVVTPCDVGLQPRVLPAESLDACTPPPPWC